ncbi:MAG: transcriptional repressor [Gemmatimonadales bacterium]|nr:transcriptional repressor [Gemmatimonadales bacterium]
MAIEKRRRNTQQRKIIQEELCALKTHPTAAELFEIVRRRLPRVSLGTVYRNLEVLHQDGRILKLEMGGAEAKFDGDTRLHHHVRCTECGAVRDVEMSEPIDPSANISDSCGFDIQGYTLKFMGTCPSCRESAGNTDKNLSH